MCGAAIGQTTWHLTYTVCGQPDDANRNSPWVTMFENCEHFFGVCECQTSQRSAASVRARASPRGSEFVILCR